jgi:SPP1 gp7 family putative phage head morphogenesis protein
MAKLTAEQIDKLFAMRPRAALRYLENRGLRIYTDPDTLLATDNAIGFRFANLARLDIAREILNAGRDVLTDGMTSHQFIEKLTPILQAKGWWGTSETINTDTGEILRRQQGSSGRLALIYRNITQQGYMAGHYETMLANAESRPYWRYRAVMDLATRPAHAALDGKIFHYTDPIWRIIFPQNGHRCRCSVDALTADEVRNQGLTILSSDEFVSREVVLGQDENGENIPGTSRGVVFTDENGEKITFWPDAGFDYNPGQSVFAANMDKYPVDIARPYVSAGLAGPELDVLYESAKRGVFPDSLLPAAIVDEMAQKNLRLNSRTLFLSERHLAAQFVADTLPARNILPIVQQVAESPDLIVLIDNEIVLFKRVNDITYRVTLDNQNIKALTVSSAQEVDQAIKTGQVITS